MSNQFLEAFEELLDAQEEAVGERYLATVGNVEADAIIEAINTDQILVNGGNAESGGFSLQMRVSDFVKPPQKLVDKVTARGITLDLLNYSEAHGIYHLTAGDVASE